MKNTPNYASASVNMGQEPASIISRTHSNNRRLQAGGIPRTGRLTTTWRIGKSLPNVPSYGVLSFGTCSISGQLIVRKATVRVSTIKGLVTFDRKVRKDAFYFYKANWNKQEPMIYLAEKRCRLRYQPEQTFMAFTTAPEAELFVNGVSCGKQKADTYSTVVWQKMSNSPRERIPFM